VILSFFIYFKDVCVGLVIFMAIKEIRWKLAKMSEIKVVEDEVPKDEVDDVLEGDPIDWLEFVEEAQPMDLVYFLGLEPISELIASVEESINEAGQYSHVGMVVTRDLLPEVSQLEEGKLYIWEAILSGDYLIGTDGILDVETGRGFFGSQIRDLQDVIKVHTSKGGKVGWGKLKNNPWNDGYATQERLRNGFNKIHQRYIHTPFDTSAVSCFGAAFAHLRPLRNLSDDFFNGIDYDNYDEYIDNEIELIDLVEDEEAKDEIKIEDEELALPESSSSESESPKQPRGSIRVIRTAPQKTHAGMMKIMERAQRKYPENFGSIPRDLPPNKVPMICSELIGMIYVTTGIVNRRFDVRDMMPTDFYSNRDTDGMPAVTELPRQIVWNPSQ
jgi:hypothetical protein